MAATERRRLVQQPIKRIDISVVSKDLTAAGAVGTYLSTVKALLAGSIVIGSRASWNKKWTGDVSATLLVGTAADDDQFMETGLDLFGTAGPGWGMPATYLTDQFITADTFPQVKVTSGSDITLVDKTAAVYVSIYYIDLNVKGI
jgi:hypothetical protein